MNQHATSLSSLIQAHGSPCYRVKHFCSVVPAGIEPTTFGALTSRGTSCQTYSYIVSETVWLLARNQRVILPSEWYTTYTTGEKVPPERHVQYDALPLSHGTWCDCSPCS